MSFRQFLRENKYEAIFRERSQKEFDLSKWKVTHAPATGSRPSGMPKVSWKNMQEKPWVVKTPNGLEMRYSTEAEAKDAITKWMPNEFEMQAWEIVKSANIWKAFASHLRRAGHDVDQNDAVTTTSQYIKIRKRGLELRYSNHSKGAPLGMNHRSNTNTVWEFSSKWSKPKLAAKIANTLYILSR